MKPILLDTGPVVALLDAADPSHAWVRDSFDMVTLDQRGFRAYRFLRNRSFRLLLQD